MFWVQTALMGEVGWGVKSLRENVGYSIKPKGRRGNSLIPDVPSLRPAASLHLRKYGLSLYLAWWRLLHPLICVINMHANVPILWLNSSDSL